MKTHVQSLKTFLADRRRAIAEKHAHGASGFETCLALTAAMDESIRTAFESIPPFNGRDKLKQIAVIALGGYGRRELCPHSDVDIMILCAAGIEREGANELARSFLHMLWDAGVDIGHSVRTVDEALAVHGQSLDAWAALLESRFVCGSEELATEFSRALRSKLGPDRWFIEGVFADIRARHDRHGNSVKLLEPNVKKSAGGLRDFHAILWLHRSGNPDYLVPAQDTDNTASAGFLGKMLQDGMLDKDDYRAAVEAVDFLLRTRHEMHFRRASLHDALDYALQIEVAEGLGFQQKDETRPVEVFMRAYYVGTRIVFRLNRQLSRPFGELLEPARTTPPNGKALGAHFMLHDGVLSVAPGLTRFADARQIFEAFTFAAENDADMDFRLMGVVERSLDIITPDERTSQETAVLFRRILNSRNVAKTLHQMNELDVLGRYIPEFGDLVAFFQHNVYHYFTADEHTLIAVANAEGLREQRGVLHEVFRNLRRKDVLYMAILLHDIGKPLGVADHEVSGVDLARNILARIGMEDAFPDIAFLIRNHLVMEQIAFRRNIHDPGTIKDFASRFERPEQLDYLYLLTYADLSAVNINVWTEWKSSMLQELYQRTSEVLRRNLKGVQIDRFHESKRAAARADLVEKLSTSIPRDHIERHLEGMQSDAYLSLFSGSDIERHIQHVTAGEPVTILFTHGEGYTEVTVIAEDAPFALSKFCAVLAANDANIFDANIFTRDDGVIIDRFRVSDASTRQHLEQRVCMKIEEDMKRVQKGEQDIAHLFAAHHRKWKRRPQLPANPGVRTDVEFEDTPRFTIIDVYAPDSVGFLYRVTETISRLGLDIYFAKIATRVDGIVDAFYVLDRSGRPVTDPAQRKLIRSEILSTVKSLSGQQLA
jgi:[protein-PII] uridylyltransferase